MRERESDWLIRFPLPSHLNESKTINKHHWILHVFFFIQAEPSNDVFVVCDVTPMLQFRAPFLLASALNARKCGERCQLLNPVLEISHFLHIARSSRTVKSFMNLQATKEPSSLSEKKKIELYKISNLIQISDEVCLPCVRSTQKYRQAIYSQLFNWRKKAKTER